MTPEARYIKGVVDCDFTFLTLVCNVAVREETISAKLQRWKFNASGDIVF